MKKCINKRGERVYREYREYRRKEDYISIGFRVSPEQKEELFRKARENAEVPDVSAQVLTGALAQRIVVMGSERLHQQIKERLKLLDPLLGEISAVEGLNEKEKAELDIIWEIRRNWS